MIARQGKRVFVAVCAVAVVALASPALATTPVVNFDDAPKVPSVSIVTATLEPNLETRLDQNWIFTNGDTLTSFLGDHVTNDAAPSNAQETSLGMKLLLGFAGLNILTRRRRWWHKASVI